MKPPTPMSISFQDMLKEGVSLTDLRVVFGINSTEIKQRLAAYNVTASGRRNNVIIYSLREAMSALGAVGLGDTEEDAEFIGKLLRTHHNKLPKMLSKEYWTAQLSKQKFEQQAGDLWPTIQVVEFCGDAFKTIRLSLQLMADTLERTSSLTDEQRKTVQTLVDTTLNDLRERLIDGFNQRGNAADGDEEPPQEGAEAEGL